MFGLKLSILSVCSWCCLAGKISGGGGGNGRV